MFLPNAVQAVVPEAKLKDYLLSKTHPVGKGKAAVYYSRGFHLDNIEELRRALTLLAISSPVVETRQTIHGMKNILSDWIDTPDGRGMFLKTIWMIDNAGTIPRLISAYPQ